MKHVVHSKYVPYLTLALVATLALSACLVWYIFAHPHAALEEEVSAYPYIDRARHFSDQKDYLTTINPLRKDLRALAAEYERGGRELSVYVEYLNTGANISINQDKYLLPASLLKLPLALAVMKKVEDGEWKLENELVLLEGDKDALSGDEDDLYGYYAVGSRFTIAELLSKLLVDSDNTAYNIFIRNVGEKNLFALIEALGLEALFNADGAISAKEYSRILRSLYSASYLNRANSQYLLELLDKATFNEFLSHEVPPDVPFPHKYGEHIKEYVFADSGIVYLTERPYLLSVVLRGREDKSLEEEKKIATDFMHEVSRRSFEYFTSAQNEAK